jgi:hypothetical protein
MRRSAWSRVMLAAMAIGFAAAATTGSARAQMCTPAIKDCESQADAEAERCARQCTRYDTVCADRCDDTHEIIVRYCWIKAGLCKAADAGQGYVKALSERK